MEESNSENPIICRTTLIVALSQRNTENTASSKDQSKTIIVELHSIGAWFETLWGTGYTVGSCGSFPYLVNALHCHYKFTSGAVCPHTFPSCHTLPLHISARCILCY